MVLKLYAAVHFIVFDMTRYAAKDLYKVISCMITGIKVIVNLKNFFSDLGSPICVVYGTKNDFSILTPFNPFFAILCFSDLPVTFPDLPLTFPDLPVTFLNLFLGASYLYTMWIKMQ